MDARKLSNEHENFPTNTEKRSRVKWEDFLCSILRKIGNSFWVRQYFFLFYFLCYSLRYISTGFENFQRKAQEIVSAFIL